MTANTQDMNMQAPNNNLQNSEPENKKSGIGGFLAYIFLPGIVPQVKELGRGGFGYLALLIATVYQAVRILPANHPYTKYENIGTFGIRQVIAAAANNVKVNKQNIDQVLIFFAVLVGIFILALQFISFVILMLSGDAWAQSAPQAGMFTTANPDTDVAFHMLREVFGIPKMFGDTTTTSFHKALHVMFNFYNLAILLVAVLVFLYYVIVVVGETAQTGTPFGQRFSHIYAPFRLVIAIGLLVPLNYGLNGAQYITLYAAKIGSSFATTGWIQFNDSLAESNPLGADNATLIAETRSPDFRALVEFMALVNTCREAYGILPEGKKKTITQKCSVTQADGKEIISDCGGATSVSSTNDIKVIFGAYEDASDFARFMPYCGTVVVPINVPVQESTENGNPGDLQRKYMEVVTSLWNNGDLKTMGKYFACVYNPYAAFGDCGTEPTQDKRHDVYSDTKKQLDSLIKNHYDDARSKADFKMRDQTKKLGWGGAGIWYNRIAQINGAYVTATISLPAGKTWPQAMEDVLKWKRDNDGSLFGCKLFEPNLANNSPPAYKDGDVGANLAGSFNAAFQFWTCDKKNTSNVFIDAASLIFGLNGLMSIRDKVKDDKGNDVQVHPLAKLSALGKGLVDAAIRNLVIAIGVAAGGGFAAGIGELQNLGAAGKAGASAIVSVATVGLSIGFITYYILPFLPFIYFFFAVGGWVKGIFEAMVGAPLWALAHLRIDGDGLPGKMAMNGYFLIFEIFLRPILTVFGLLGGMAIFTALASILNDIFDIVVENTANVNLQQETGRTEFSRHIIDIFFFTCVYAVILYMMAISSFKMINLVPNNILRWLGQSVSSFNDSAQDPAQGLTQYAAIGGAKIGGQLAGGMTQLGEAAGGIPGGLVGMLSKK